MIRRASTLAVLTVLGFGPAVAGARAASGPPAVQAPPTGVTINAARPQAPIAPAVFGSTMLAPAGGMGAFDASRDRFWPSFLRDVANGVYVGSLRFPGGITAESYQWQKAIGPQAARLPNPVAPANGPSDSTVGPDEFGQLLDRTGAAGVMTVNFATGSPADAAALVQYMTGKPGSSAWADRRVADGHRAPYDVPWWEIGNEEQVSPYWALAPPVHVGGPAGACKDVETCLYIYGGTTTISRRPVVTDDDRRIVADISPGRPNETFQVTYPPVVSGTTTVFVANQPWTQVASLATAGPTDLVYTLDPVTGQITFGDGVHGAVPFQGAHITASYQSGPHPGFLDFYAAMKRVNPAIHVCSSETSLRFIEAMGSHLPYDCLQVHPYISPRTLSSSEPIAAYERKVMGAPFLEAQAVAKREAQTAVHAKRHVPVVLSEYGQLVSSTPDRALVPYYLSSLDEALLNASQLADFIRLGVPVADRQLLNSELPPASLTTASLRHIAPWSAGGAIVTDGVRSVVEPTGQMLELMKPLAGERRLGISVAADPQLTSAAGHPIGDLSIVSGAGHGRLDIVAVNRNPDAAVAAHVSIAGFYGSGTGTVTTLNGPSALSFNQLGLPPSVTTRSTHVRIDLGQASLTLPAHSITRLTLTGL